MEQLLNQMKEEAKSLKYDTFVNLFIENNQKMKEINKRQEILKKEIEILEKEEQDYYEEDIEQFENERKTKEKEREIIQKEINKKEKETVSFVDSSLTEYFLNNFESFKKESTDFRNMLSKNISNFTERELLLFPMFFAAFFETINSKELIPFIKNMIQSDSVNCFFGVSTTLSSTIENKLNN